MTIDTDSKLTLKDYLDYDTELLSIGLNPSLVSVQLGFYFANPRNRFWRALDSSQLLSEPLQVNAHVHERLTAEYRLGFTDVVKRATSSGGQLRAADFKRDAPMLRAKLERYQPAWLWFHGKVAFQQLLFYAYGLRGQWHWGWNEVPLITSKVFVSPNPSSANAIFSLQDLVTYYNELAMTMRASNERQNKA